MSESTAWILDLGDSVHVAVGELEFVHLIGEPKLFDVPKTPDYCRYTLIWENIIVPVVDLAYGLQGKAVAREVVYAAVMRYKLEKQGSFKYAALLLSALPERVDISDSLACPLPEQPQAWKALAISCFTQDGKAVPIIGLGRLFSKATQKILK